MPTYLGPLIETVEYSVPGTNMSVRVEAKSWDNGLGYNVTNLHGGNFAGAWGRDNYGDAMSCARVAMAWMIRLENHVQNEHKEHIVSRCTECEA